MIQRIKITAKGVAIQYQERGAAVDVAATSRCYFEMRRQGLIGGLKKGEVTV